MFTKLIDLAQNQEMMKYVKNSSWILLEYSLRIISGIFVTLYLARYLGSDDFGLLSFCLAIIAVAVVIARLGMENILIRDIHNNVTDASNYMGTAFTMMLLTSILLVACLNIILWVFDVKPEISLILSIISISILFQSFLVYDYSFQGQVIAKYSSISKSLALVSSSLVKVILIWNESSLTFIAISYVFDALIMSFLLFVTYKYKLKNESSLSFTKELVPVLSKSIFPMVLTGLAGVLTVRTDQIMIGTMLDNKSLGIYASASKIFEGFSLLPAVILTALYPVILGMKKLDRKLYEKKLSYFLAVLFWIFVLISALVSYFSDSIVFYVLGREYQDSSGILSLLIWALPLSVVASFSSKYFSVEKIEKHILHRVTIALILNVVINYFFIPIYGVYGAVYATLLSLLFAHVIVDLFWFGENGIKRIKKMALFRLKIR